MIDNGDRPVKSMMAVVAEDLDDDCDVMGVMATLNTEGRSKSSDLEVAANFALLDGQIDEVSVRIGG